MQNFCLILCVVFEINVHEGFFEYCENATFCPVGARDLFDSFLLLQIILAPLKVSNVQSLTRRLFI